jgi:hypothetical protein
MWNWVGATKPSGVTPPLPEDGADLTPGGVLSGLRLVGDNTADRTEGFLDHDHGVVD